MTRAKSWGAVGLFLGLFATAFLLRITTLGLVFVEGRVRFPAGSDELYHVRRIVYQVARFPELLDFDPYVSFPFGATPLWPPYLDWVIAALVRQIAAPADAVALEWAIAWIPPLLGAVTVALIGEIGRRHFSLLAGLVAGLLLAVMPAHHMHSQLGQVDHQVVLGLCTVLLLGGAMAWLAENGARRSGARAAGVGLVIAGSLLVSPGALLQILPVQAALIVWVLAAAERADAVGRARSAALAHGSAAALLAPASLANRPLAGFGAHSPLVLSDFQPLWFGAGAASLVIAAQIWKRSDAWAGRAARVGSALALAGVGSAVAFALIPDLHSSLAYAAGWFTHEETFLSIVMELQPLLYPVGRFEPASALRSLTAALFVFPLAWLWLAFRRGLDPHPRTALLLVWSGAFFVLALAQERFANVFAPGLALTLGVAVQKLCAMAQRRLPRGARLAVGAVLAALVVATLTLPVLDYGRFFAATRHALTRGQAPVPRNWRRKVVVDKAARWLRDASPPTRGFLDANLRPEYGVLTNWGDGHLVRYRAERPTVQDNFGIFADRRAFDLARDYFESEDEEAAYRAALALGARYTVATHHGSGQMLQRSRHSVGQRLWRRLGNGAPEGSRVGSPALARHRLLWVGDLSGRARDVQRPAPDRVAVFEIVPGSRIVGDATPGEHVRFELELRAGAGRVWYRAGTRASLAGRYEIRLPYPTDTAVSTEVGARGAYQVRGEDRSAAFELPETDVRAGATRTGPDLRRPARGAPQAGHAVP